MSDDQGTDENEGTPEAPPVDDWRSKFEAQQKVARDLEKRTKSDLNKMKALERELEALREGSAPKDEVASELEKARKEAAAEATAVANRRIVKAEIKAAATAKFADPADAIAFLDLDQFQVDDDGEVDNAAIMTALDDLLEKKPHLGAKGSARWSGSGDGGHRGEASVNVTPGIGRLTHAYSQNAKK